MKNLGNRLKKIADMVSGETIADIGSDHGYLPIWLSLNKKIKKAYALDISPNCVEKIKKNIKKQNIPENMVIPAISDGLSYFGENPGFEELSDIIIAGMSGETISEIIEKMPYNINKINFILQPNSKIESLKKFLTNNNFDITECAVIESKKRFYTIIKCNTKKEKNDRIRIV